MELKQHSEYSLSLAVFYFWIFLPFFSALVHVMEYSISSTAFQICPHPKYYMINLCFLDSAWNNYLILPFTYCLHKPVIPPHESIFTRWLSSMTRIHKKESKANHGVIRTGTSPHLFSCAVPSSAYFRFEIHSYWLSLMSQRKLARKRRTQTLHKHHEPRLLHVNNHYLYSLQFSCRRRLLPIRYFRMDWITS